MHKPKTVHITIISGHLLLGLLQPPRINDWLQVGLGGMSAVTGVQLGLHPGHTAHCLYHLVKYIQNHNLNRISGEGKILMQLCTLHMHRCIP